MSKLGRDPILRGELQTDLDGKGFNIRDVNAVGNVQQATLHVDPSLAEEIGERATGLPFRTLGAAVAAAEPGDVIQLRPGIHAYNGSVDIADLDGLKIFGHGAIIKSASAVNESRKISVSSADVLIEGIEFDGEVTVDRTDSLDGCIAVSGNGCLVRRCNIHDQNAHGVRLNPGFQALQILESRIVNCAGGVRVVSDVATIVDTVGVFVERCGIAGNRTYGVSIFGPGVANGNNLGRIEINDNRINSNNTIASTYAGIFIGSACEHIIINGNEIRYEETAISLTECKNAEISNNDIRGSITGMLIVGCWNLNITDNMVDGRNAAGTAVMAAALTVSGSYLVANDASNFTITGNWFGFFPSTSPSVQISNVTGILLNDNLVGAPIFLSAVVRAQVQNNQIVVGAITQGILINAANRATSQITISGNRFFFFGASINRAICTVDASGFGIDDVLIHGNSTQIGETFAIATYSHSGSNLPTNVVLLDNTPEAHTTVATGWANAQQNLAIGKVLVSQSRGDDADGVRQDRNLKFQTIAAAITAASSGDTVVVEDGTFDERLDAKDGITVRFMPPAHLAVTTAAGCIRTTADDTTFTVYHEHTAMTCSTASTAGITVSHEDANIKLHGSISVTGTGASSFGINVTHGTIEIWGHVSAASAAALRTGTTGEDDPFIVMHGGIDPILQGFRDIQTSTGAAISIVDGGILANDCHIFGPTGASVTTSHASILFRRCNIQSTTASTAAIGVSGSNVATIAFRDCSLYSGAGATQSINAAGAQTVKITGTLNANNGPNPPTNVTFDGPGTYAVDSGMFPF